MALKNDDHSLFTNEDLIWSVTGIPPDNQGSDKMYFKTGTPSILTRSPKATFVPLSPTQTQFHDIELLTQDSGLSMKRRYGAMLRTKVVHNRQICIC